MSSKAIELTANKIQDILVPVGSGTKIRLLGEPPDFMYWITQGVEPGMIQSVTMSNFDEFLEMAVAPASAAKMTELIESNNWGPQSRFGAATQAWRNCMRMDVGDDPLSERRASVLESIAKRLQAAEDRVEQIADDAAEDAADPLD